MTDRDAEEADLESGKSRIEVRVELGPGGLWLRGGGGYVGPFRTVEAARDHATDLGYRFMESGS